MRLRGPRSAVCPPAAAGLRAGRDGALLAGLGCGSRCFSPFSLQLFIGAGETRCSRLRSLYLFILFFITSGFSLCFAPLLPARLCLSHPCVHGERNKSPFSPTAGSIVSAACSQLPAHGAAELQPELGAGPAGRDRGGNGTGPAPAGGKAASPRSSPSCPGWWWWWCWGGGGGATCS